MNRKPTHIAVYSLLGVVAVVVFRAAWMCDDAFITFRVIDNWANGYGLRWNVVERVQVFTHPLWMLLIAALHFITGELYYTCLAVSMGLTVAAAAVFAFKICGRPAIAILGLASLIVSKAFIEYGTSGLENSLSYFLLVVFYWRYLAGEPSRRNLLELALLSSLIALNRMDAVLLCLPGLAHASAARGIIQSIKTIALGWLPFLGWALFSLIYYGFILPNTAYAKLFHGLDQPLLLQNSLYYFTNSIQQDPATLVLIGFSLLFAVWRGDPRRRMIALGVFFYLVYLAKIGGDFMSGRLLTLPFVGAVVVASGAKIELKSWTFAIWILLVLVLAFSAPNPIVLSGADYGLAQPRRDAHDIADERAEYYQKTGLLKFIGQPFSAGWMLRFLDGVRADEGNVITQGNMGLMGYYAGPEVYLIDVFGLTDPLLARLPARQDCVQRPGHYFRVLPVGYVDAIHSGELKFRDPTLARLYEQLALVTQGPLFSLERWRAILKLNLGFCGPLIDRDYYKSKPQTVFTLDELSLRVEDGADWGHEDTHIFTTDWMSIQFGSAQGFPQFELSLDSSDRYAVQFLTQGAITAQVIVADATTVVRGMASRLISTPTEALEAGFDEVRISPIEGDGYYSMGHFIPGIE